MELIIVIKRKWNKKVQHFSRYTITYGGYKADLRTYTKRKKVILIKSERRTRITCKGKRNNG